MSLDNLLRDFARQDLQRFCPVGHYWLRDHEPMADRELIEPLLKEPVRFGLTPRENLAANALSDLTTYTIRSRAIWEATYQVKDSDDPTPATGTTFDQEREITGRREVYRRSALVYARMLGDSQLIEHYQPLKQIEPLYSSSYNLKPKSNFFANIALQDDETWKLNRLLKYSTRTRGILFGRSNFSFKTFAL